MKNNDSNIHLASIQQRLQVLEVRDVRTSQQGFINSFQKIAGSGPIGVPSDRRFFVYFAESFIQAPEDYHQRRPHVVGRPFGRRKDVVHVSPQTAAAHGSRIVR